MKSVLGTVCACMMVMACSTEGSLRNDSQSLRERILSEQRSNVGVRPDKVIWEPSFKNSDARSPEVIPGGSGKSIYYELDAVNIKTEYHSMLKAHAVQLHAQPDLFLRIEGNCDERGSREYNLALGQRRADTVKRALVLSGVDEAQIDVVSLGAEKPKAKGHSEQDFSENRRSDLLFNNGNEAM